jgi:nitrous oxidase accessory protein NosD
MAPLSRRAFCALAAIAAGVIPGGVSPTERASAMAHSDVVVTSEAGLESTFRNLSPGQTVFVGADGAPYRTTGWLDVDADGVTVLGPGIDSLLRPAPDADVGGIRIGHDRHCRDVEIRGVGYRGDDVADTSGASRCHGILVEDATNVTLERNRIRGTRPRTHGDGGSGISVKPPCSGVQIANNRIHDYGDRGIQLGGTQLSVYGNFVANGLDRPIACDVWHADARNATAGNASIFGNLLGNSAEGSLVGVARNDPTSPAAGHVTIFGNVGYGHHKSFCHLRGPRELANVSVENNVSVHRTDGLETEATTTFSGVAVDVDGGRNVAVEDNDLYGYSGHGVRVNSAVTGVTVRGNSLVNPGLSGVRLEGGADGLVGGNRITGPGAAGIVVRDATAIVDGNDVRKSAGAGVVVEESPPDATAEILRNVVNATAGKPGIRIRDSGALVRGNTIRTDAGPAIVEADSVADNVYVGNQSDGDRPWRITSASSVVRNNVPAVDVHRGVTTGASSNVAVVEFDRPYERPPRLSFGRTGGGVERRRFETDANGNYVGVAVTTREADATLDVFVDDG